MNMNHVPINHGSDKDEHQLEGESYYNSLNYQAGEAVDAVGKENWKRETGRWVVGAKKMIAAMFVGYRSCMFEGGLYTWR